MLLFLNLIIVPKKHALHSVSMAWLVPYIFFTLFYSTGYTTDYSLILNTTSKVVSNTGAILITLIILWIFYLTVFLFTLKNKAQILLKMLKMIKYFLLTFHAFFFFGLAFAFLNTFTKYVNYNKVDGANLFIGLIVLTTICAFIVYIWYATYKKFEVDHNEVNETKK